MDECDLDWDHYDHVDDYCRECGTEFKLMMDMYILQMPKIAMGDIEIINIYIKTPEGKEITLI